MFRKALGVVENGSVGCDIEKEKEEKTDPVLLQGVCCKYRGPFIDDGQVFFREAMMKVSSSWVRFGVHHCRALHSTLFCARELSFKSGTSAAPSKEQNKCVCRLLIHLSSDVSALGCFT